MIKEPTTEKQKTISIERTFDLPLEAVWKAWTEPESCKKWFGPEGYTCPDCNIDLKVGGKYLISMQGPDGKKIWSTGTYQEILPMKKLVYTDSFADSEGNVVNASEYDMAGDWSMECIVTVEFEYAEGKTRIKLNHSGLPVEISDDCIKGWQSSFNKLESSQKN